MLRKIDHGNASRSKCPAAAVLICMLLALTCFNGCGGAGGDPGQKRAVPPLAAGAASLPVDAIETEPPRLEIVPGAKDYLVAFWQEDDGWLGNAHFSLNSPAHSLRTLAAAFTEAFSDANGGHGFGDIVPIVPLSSLDLTPRRLLSPGSPPLSSEREGGRDGEGWLTDLRAGLFHGSKLRASRGVVIAAVAFESPEQAASTLTAWEAEGRVAFAEPDLAAQPASLQEGGTQRLEELFEPYGGDAGAASAWWLQNVNLAAGLDRLSAKAAGDPAWADELFRNPPVVAILDSGIDWEHPALADRLITADAANAAGCANDRFGCNTTVLKKGYLGNGDVFPYGTNGPSQPCGPNFGDFSGLEGEELDTGGMGGDSENSRVSADEGVCGHGTHVAGLIAGVPNLQEGTGGVCPFCKILAVRVVSDKLGGKIPDSAILAGLKYISLFKRGGKPLARVINMSFGKYTRSRSVSLMIRLLREQGTLMIAAAGNEDSMKRSYPAGYGDAIAVSALDREFRRAPYSNFGPWVDIAAPGGAAQDVTSSFPGGQWRGQNGTSQATPIVAGVAGLYVAANPDASYEEIRNALISSANGSIYGEDVAEGYNHHYLKRVEGDNINRPLLGSGIVDADAALGGVVQGYVAAQADRRVTPGCGVIGSGAGRAQFPFGAGLILLAVLGLVAFGLACRGELAQAQRQRSPEPANSSSRLQ